MYRIAAAAAVVSLAACELPEPIDKPEPPAPIATPEKVPARPATAPGSTTASKPAATPATISAPKTKPVGSTSGTTMVLVAPTPLPRWVEAAAAGPATTWSGSSTHESAPSSTATSSEPIASETARIESAEAKPALKPPARIEPSAVMANPEAAASSASKPVTPTLAAAAVKDEPVRTALAQRDPVIQIPNRSYFSEPQIVATPPKAALPGLDTKPAATATPTKVTETSVPATPQSEPSVPPTTKAAETAVETPPVVPKADAVSAPPAPATAPKAAAELPKTEAPAPKPKPKAETVTPSKTEASTTIVATATPAVVAALPSMPAATVPASAPVEPAKPAVEAAVAGPVPPPELAIKGGRFAGMPLPNLPSLVPDAANPPEASVEVARNETPSAPALVATATPTALAENAAAALRLAAERTGLTDLQLARIDESRRLIATGDAALALDLMRELNTELDAAATGYTVAAGDSLRRIAEKPEVYGNTDLWPLIWRANVAQLKEANQLYKGMRLRVPSNPTVTEVTAAIDYARSHGDEGQRPAIELPLAAAP